MKKSIVILMFVYLPISTLFTQYYNMTVLGFSFWETVSPFLILFFLFLHGSLKKNPKDLFSVILLAETVNAILNQTFTDFELIIVDNFSNYNFFEHVESFNDKRILPFQNQNDGVIAANRNFGIKKAQGTYIAFCDDDDVWINIKLEKQLDFLKSHNCDLVSSQMFLFKEKTDQYYKIQENKPVNNLNDLLRKNQINTSTVFLRKSELVIFDENYVLVSIEDYALWIKLYINGYKFGFINEPLTYYRVLDNFSTQNWSIKHLRIMYHLIQLKVSHPEINIHKQIFWQAIKYFAKRIYSELISFLDRIKN